jgi:hypothetical protein
MRLDFGGWFFQLRLLSARNRERLTKLTLSCPLMPMM